MITHIIKFTESDLKLSQEIILLHYNTLLQEKILNSVISYTNRTVVIGFQHRNVDSSKCMLKYTCHRIEVFIDHSISAL